ncbi:MAG: photosystem I assembly protein Ycf4 [Thermosynechococcaceae cyanobacterium]
MTSVLRYTVLGSRRLSNYWWASVVTVAGSGFLLAGASSYFQVDLLPMGSSIDLIFIPQGIVIGAYGVAALLLGAYLWAAIALDLGGGYNEFNKDTGMLNILRRGYLGKNRRIEVSSRLTDVQAVRINIRGGLSPKRTLYLKVKGRGDIPLTRVGQPLPISIIEGQAAEIAQFLGVPMEGL